MHRNLRILMFCPQFRPLVGGYERAAERLALELSRQGHHVDVVTERRDPAWPKVESLEGVTLYRLWCRADPKWHTPSAALSLVWFFLRRARQYDVIHIHQYGPTAAVAIAMGHWLGKKVVLKLTNTGEYGLDAALPRSALGRRIRTLHRSVDACVATSARAAAEAKAFGIAENRIYQIPNALDVERFRPPSPQEKKEAREALGLQADLIALNVCRLAREKNQTLLVDAWLDFQSSATDAALAILGDGPLKSTLESQIDAAELKSSVHLLGHVADPRPWYWSADFFVLSSDSEGLSNSLMEALCCGLPMVSTRVSGSEDIAAEAEVGLLVEPGDRQALTEALRRMVADPQWRAECGSRSRTYAEAQYALGVVAEKTLALYREILSDRGA